VSRGAIVGGKRRRYYQITTAGAEALENAREHTRELMREINKE